MEFAQFLPSLEVSLQETLAQKDKLYLVEENTKNNIDRRSEEIHKSVEDVRITLHNEVKDIIQGEVTRLEVHEKELNRWIVWLRNKISENDTKNETTLTNQKMTSENSASNPETNDGVLGTLESLTEFEHTLIQFKSETGCNFIDENFGRIDYYTVILPDFSHLSPRKEQTVIKPKLLAEFQCAEKGNIHAIAPMSNSKAWICSGWGSKTIGLYTLEGKRKMSMSLQIPVDHMIYTSKGDILISGYKQEAVHRLDEQLEMSMFAKLDFIPRGMTVTNDGEVFVCGLRRNGSSSTSSPDDEKETSHVIAKFSSQGKFISEMVISPRDPHRISMTPDGNISVSFLGKNNKRQLMIMDQQGIPLKVYRGGDNVESNTFYPLGTVCDRYGHIIVTDWNNDSVHLLDKNGNLMQYLLTENDEFSSPSALALDRAGNVWIGNAVGKIRVYQYLS